MKNILLITLIAFSINAKAQITLEHTYDSAGVFFSNTGPQQLYIVNLEVSGEKIVFVDRVDKLVRFYNLNHTPWKTISFSAATDLWPNINEQSILYISQHLFNTDDAIEFMYVDYTESQDTIITQIINEDGSILFTANQQAPAIITNVPQAQVPIYNTTSGTKLILSGKDGKAYFYGLAGTLAAGIQESNAQLIQAQRGQFSNLYPNPSKGAVTLQYQLPEGVQEGELVLYNMQGTEVKRYKVDNTFKDMLLDNTQLTAGTYFYQLQTNKGEVGTKKMVGDKIVSLANKQDSINASLQNQLNQLLIIINNCCNIKPSGLKQSTDTTQTQSLTKQTDVVLNDAQSVVLEQNVPNPFAEHTTISYNLPDNTTRAQMLFYNSQGKLIQTAELVNTGRGMLNVFASDLSSGIYTYSLVVDGKIIETKKMVKQ